MKIINYILIYFVICMSLSSCSEYLRIQKSGDNSLKYSYAKKYFNQKKYQKSSELLEEIVPYFKGTSEGGQSLYLLAESYYHLGLMRSASTCYESYTSIYPKGEMAQIAMFKAGESLAKDIPDPRLDQSETYKAIELLQKYIEHYPEGKYSKEAELSLYNLQDNLAEKEYLAAKLYYNLGEFMGNNYLSCIITANQALKEYPYSKWREDFMFLVLKANYKQALLSVLSKEQIRYRTVIDQYYAYINDYPNGKYTKEAKQIYAKVKKIIGEK